MLSKLIDAAPADSASTTDLPQLVEYGSITSREAKRLADQLAAKLGSSANQNLPKGRRS
jgi:hypothetical protein